MKETLKATKNHSDDNYKAPIVIHGELINVHLCNFYLRGFWEFPKGQKVIYLTFSSEYIPGSYRVKDYDLVVRLMVPESENEYEVNTTGFQDQFVKERLKRSPTGALYVKLEYEV